MRHLRVVVLVLLGPQLIFAVGCNQKRDVVESLRSPIHIKGWTQAGLLLEDGRLLVVPEVNLLPTSSLALKEATRGGVEVIGGRIYCLVQVHHWCGNDPIRKHIARLDLSNFLTFLGVGQVSEASREKRESEGLAPEGGSFSDAGWRAEEYFAFKSWQRVH